MSGRIPRAFIDELLMRVDIVDLIDSHHPLKKSGSSFTARCPFHEEKTPSFNVNRNKQLYHCFGCHASGNAISFLMDFNHSSFVEAVEDLARFVGVDVPRENNFQAAVEKAPTAPIYAVLENVAAFYAEQLQMPAGEAARQYLARRGVEQTVIARFGLGFSPNHWDELLKRFNQQQLMDAGLLVQHESGRCYDRFRGRLMFPIRDRRKRVIGFGGRVLDDSKPKYLNSPETAVFSKGLELYGLCELLEQSNKPQRILLVEGYMDVIALAQFGIAYAVAALGTATSKTHLEQLFRFSNEVVLCFDGDNAGRQAAWRAMEAVFPCLRDGRQVRIMLLPQGEDPDSLVRQEGVAAFETRIDTAQMLSDYFFTSLTATVDLNTMEGGAKLVNSAKPYLEKMPVGIFKDMMWAKLKELSRAPVLDVSTKTATLSKPDGKKLAKTAGQASSLSRRLLALLLQKPQLAQALEAQDLDWQNPYILAVIGEVAHQLLQDIRSIIKTHKPPNTAMLLELYRNTKDERTVNALAKLNFEIPEGGEQADFLGILQRIAAKAVDMEIDALSCSADLNTAGQERLNQLLQTKKKRLIG